MGTGSEIGPYEEKSMFREVDAEYEDLSTLSVVGSAVFDGQEARSPSCLPLRLRSYGCECELVKLTSSTTYRTATWRKFLEAEIEKAAHGTEKRLAVKSRADQRQL